MTQHNKYVTIIIVIGLAVFLFVGLALSKRGRLIDCSPDNTLNSAFFIREDMPRWDNPNCGFQKGHPNFHNTHVSQFCSIEGCEEKSN